MLSKRLIGVVTVKDEIAVQSIGFNRYLPLGKPECLVENLDRWGADEILVQVIDRSKKKLGPDFGLISRIADLGLKTPLIYAGGISNAIDGILAIQRGADRIVIDSLLHDNIDHVRSLSNSLGAQALIASLPLSISGSDLLLLDYRNGISSKLHNPLLKFLEKKIVSEILIIDWLHEGFPLSFDNRLIQRFSQYDLSFVVFGGISDSTQICNLISTKNVSAVAIGNFLNFNEHSLQKFKEKLAESPVRNPTYDAKFSS